MSHLTDERVFEELADVVAKIKQLDKYKSLLVESINQRIEDGQLEHLRKGKAWCHGRAVVRQQTKRTYCYSDAVKNLKAQEECEGIASVKLTIYSVVSLRDE